MSLKGSAEVLLRHYPRAVDNSQFCAVFRSSLRVSRRKSRRQVFIGTGASKTLTEKAIEAGPAESKIAVIKIEGIINNELAEDVAAQIKAAKKDENVKAVIFKTTSPGGGIGASDRIYDQILRLKAETGKPTIAFMDTNAASGCSYTSSACVQIIAEPTVITGSSGVIMGHFVLQDLLEQKLGVKPVIIKSGSKKDWPTSFIF